MIGAGAAAHTARPLLAPTAVAVPVQTGHASPDSSVQGQGVDPLPRPPNAVAKCTGKARISVLRRAVRRMKQPKRRAVPRLSCREPFLEGPLHLKGALSTPPQKTPKHNSRRAPREALLQPATQGLHLRRGPAASSPGRGDQGSPPLAPGDRATNPLRPAPTPLTPPPWAAARGRLAAPTAGAAPGGSPCRRGPTPRGCRAGRWS